MRTVRPCGRHAVLVEIDDPVDLAGVIAALDNDRPGGVTDVVPGACTVLLDARPGTDVAALGRYVRELDARTGAPPRGDDVVLDVRYDGDDLAEVARLLAMTPAEVVAAHAGQTWTVAFCGFAPGFAYLTGEHDRLRVPRRDTPRTRVPAGAVGLADAWSGVYPTASPGGWQLIGRTGAALFDVDRDPPALLRPGTRVRFRELR